MISKQELDMKIRKKVNQETETSIIQNENIHILDMLNPLKKKTTDELYKLLSFGILIAFLINILGKWNSLVFLIQNLGNLKLYFYEYKESYPYYLIVLFCFLILTVAFLKKKRIGWIGLNIFFIPVIITYFLQFVFIILWLTTKVIFENNLLFDIFNFQVFFSTLGSFLLYILIIILLNKKEIREKFRITKFQRFGTYGIAFIFILIFAYIILPDSLQDANGQRKNLPKEYYKKIDLPNTKM